jgi:hypothetical protein
LAPAHWYPSGKRSFAETSSVYRASDHLWSQVVVEIMREVYLCVHEAWVVAQQAVINKLVSASLVVNLEVPCPPIAYNPFRFLPGHGI